VGSHRAVELGLGELAANAVNLRYHGNFGDGHMIWSDSYDGTIVSVDETVILRGIAFTDKAQTVKS